MRCPPIGEDDVGLPLVGIRHRSRVMRDTEIASRSIPIGVPGAVRFLLRVAAPARPPWAATAEQGGDVMTCVVVVGDLMTDAVARAQYPLAKGGDTPAKVTMHGGGSGANVASWLAVEGVEAAFVGRRGADIWALCAS